MASKLKLLLVIFFSGSIYAQDAEIFAPDSIKKTVYAIETEKSIVIDGKLDEEVWGITQESPRFTQINPYQGEDPSQETQIKVLYDDTYLYFGIICLTILAWTVDAHLHGGNFYSRLNGLLKKIHIG